jgi:hypothetical protein
MNESNSTVRHVSLQKRAYMWRLMKEIGTYGGCSYGHDDLGNVVVDLDKRELDPIHVAGGVQLQQLATRSKKPWMEPMSTITASALSFLMIPLFFMAILAQPYPMTPAHPDQERHYSASKWLAHLTALHEWHILEPCSATDVVFISRYFAVEKGPDLARAILNGRLLSSYLKTPPAVNLPSLTQVLRMTSAIVEPGVYVILGDLRHWFHQLPLHHDIQKFMGVACRLAGERDRFWKWTTLPMGLSWSPFIAQAIGLLLITYKEEQEDNLFDFSNLDVDSQLPQYLRLISGGFICIYYDNIFAVGTCGKTMAELLRRLGRTMTLFNVIVKEPGLILMTPKTLRTQSFHLLGVEMRVMRKRLADDKTFVHQLSWRQIPEKLSRWASDGLENLTTAVFSPRKLASIIGRILWRHSIRLRPLCGVVDIISILKKTALHRALEGNGWDVRNLTLTVDELKSLRVEWGKILENPWESNLHTSGQKRRVWTCSDASDEAGCFLIYSTNGAHCVYQETFKWNNVERSWHIYVKEAIAAIRCVLYVLKTYDSGTEIVIGIDNTAAAVAIERSYSSNLMVTKMLDDMSSKCEKHMSFVTTVGVRSKENASDPGSRPSENLKLTPDLLSLCKHTMEEAYNGRRKTPGEEDKQAPLFNGELRHQANQKWQEADENESTQQEWLEDFIEAHV